MSLKIYDIGIDDYREVTQDDVDALFRVSQEYGRMRVALSKLHVDFGITPEQRRKMPEVKTERIDFITQPASMTNGRLRDCTFDLAEAERPE